MSNDFDLLVAIGDNIRDELELGNDAWEESPFRWVLSLPPRTKGKLGERLVRGWIASNGLKIGNSPDSEADILINEKRVEIKLSTLWKTGQFKFQQIRDQNYEYLVAIGIAPNEAYCWVISKDLLHQHVIGHLPQHKGAEGSDTFWFSVSPEEPPSWLENVGGTLKDALVILKSLS